MANLFLGFPVSRAKIASMIEGSAPPITHGLWHEPDGADPIIAPGDISSGQNVNWNGTKFVGLTPAGGGVSLPWDDIFFDMLVADLRPFNSSTSGSATITDGALYMTLATGTTAGSTCSFGLIKSYYYTPYIWTKARKFKAYVSISVPSTNVADIFIGCGNAGNFHHIGFLWTGGKLYGTVYNGSSESTVELADYGGVPYSDSIYLMFDWDGSSQVDFYCDGVKEGEITTNLPTGNTQANRLLHIYLENLTENLDRYMRISEFSVWQEA